MFSLPPFQIFFRAASAPWVADSPCFPMARKPPEHRYNTRQQPQHVGSTSLQIVAGTCNELAQPAGSVDAQQAFLQGVGMIRTDVEALEDVLPTSDALLLTCALEHRRIEDSNLTDPYFTEEEWQRVLKTRTQLLDEADDMLGDVVPTSKEKASDWVQRKRSIPLCNCQVHQCDNELYLDVLSVLVSLPKPLNDDTGNTFAQVFLAHILKSSNLTRLTVRGTRGGTIGRVHFILRLPSGTEYVYTGWPDLHLVQRFTQEERRLGVRLGLEETVRGIGEVQSPPGTSNSAKNRAFAQAGIYTLGHFKNTHSISKLATVIFYKDLTAHVALATINRVPEVTSSGVIGDVTYKLVNGVNPYDLRLVEDMKRFASVFIATLKTTLV